MAKQIAAGRRRRGFALALLGQGALLALDAPGAVAAGRLSNDASTAVAPNATRTAALPNFVDVIAQVKPAVIRVRVTVKPGSNDQLLLERLLRQRGVRPGRRDDGFEGRQEGAINAGSGFIISTDGYAVTSHHVIENAEAIESTTDDGKT